MRHPQLLEDITRDPRLNRAVDTSGHLQRLRSIGQSEATLGAVRAYRQRQLLRIILRDVLGLADATMLYQEQSDLAEACLVFVNEILGGAGLTIIGMGKFGGREITYGADLDVLFVGNESGAAQKLLSALAQPSAEGNLSRVDARLRPEGEKGPLVCSLKTYEIYFNNRAQPWELQALTRARPILGPLQNDFIEIARSAWQKCGQNRDLYVSINSMLERIRRERGSGSDFFALKTGIGGIIEAEFLVQALQMRAGISNPQMTGTVEELVEGGIMVKRDAETLRKHYEYLRSIGSILRRWENKSISVLPSDRIEQEKLAARAGAKGLDAFAQAYREARTGIHAIYLRYLR